MPPAASLRTGRSCAQYSLITADREQSGGAERVGRVAASKGKDAQDGLQVSLIPVIERQQEQLRKELDQAEQNIQQGRQFASELTEQTREKRPCEIQTRADAVNVLVRADSLRGD